MAEAKLKESAKESASQYASITEALVAFQASIPIIGKDSSANTGKFSYDYASLDKLTPVVFKALTDVGIAYSAVPTVREDGLFVLRAQLLHTSGEIISGDYPLGSPSNPAQAIGSAITYARRYALLSMTGVSPTGEDDDGAKASESQASAPAEAKAPVASSATALRDDLAKYISGTNGVLTGDDANTILGEITGGKSPAAWTVADLKKAKSQLEALEKTRKDG